MLANCSSGTGTVPTTFGSKPAGIQIRDVSFDDYLEESPNEDYPMPYETYLFDVEMAEYRKQQQQQLLTDGSQEQVEDPPIVHLRSPFSNLARQQRLHELENEKKQRANIEVEAIML